MSSADDADTLALFATYDDYWRYYNNCQQQQQQVHGQALPSLPSSPVHVDVPSPSPSPSSLSWCVRADECAHTRSHVATTTTMPAAAGRKAVQRQLCSACVVGCGVVTPSPSASQPRCSLGSVCCHDGGGEDDDGDGVSASRARSTATTSTTTAVGATTVARELFDDATPSPTLQAPTRHVNDTDSVTVLMSSDDDDDDEEMMDNTRARAAAASAVTDEERAAVLRLYAGKLTPTEQQCDDLVAYLAWAQQRSRVRRDMLAAYTRHHHHNSNNSNESEAVAMALLAAYAQQHSAPTATGDSDKETAAVYVATPQSPARHGSDKQQQQQHNDSKGTDDDSSSSNSSAAAAAATTRNTMTAALTPHAAPARFVRWVATEVDCYEGVLSMLLPHSSSSRVHVRHV